MKYRAEIDGLRTVAVVPVILFHAGVPGFAGGFVGVDIFFVISGYLITTIIWAEMAAGDFSIKRFYERRLRRILPMLAFVSLCSVPFAFFLMFPSEFEAFGRSLISSQLFVSNILFWQESGYFAAEAELKPLLHTWSLAIEEQFYIFFPPLLLALSFLPRKIVVGVLIAIALLSFALSEWASTRYASANFYLLPTRAWELGIGAILAIVWGEASLRSAAWRQAVSLIGFVAILASLILLDGETPFPGVWAALPVGGTAAVLLAAQRDTWVGRLLSQRAFVGIGLISYSAYLWHQPILAFVRLRSLTEPGPIVIAAAVLLTFALSWLSWRYVEAPFRRKSLFDQRAIFRLSAPVIVGIASLGCVLAFVPDLNRSTLRMTYSNFETYEDYDRSNRSALFALTDHFRRGSCFITPEFAGFDDAACLPVEPKKPNFVLMGDSNAAHWWRALQDAFPDVNIMQATATTCYPLIGADGQRHCTDLRERVFDTVLQDPRIDGVILSATWRGVSEAQLENTVNALVSSGKAVAVLGPGIQYTTPVSRMMQKMNDDDPAVQRRVLSHAMEAGRDELSDRMQAIVVGAGGHFIPVQQALCDTKGCPVFASNGQLMIFDTDHYTLGGARDAVQLISAGLAPAFEESAQSSGG